MVNETFSKIMLSANKIDTLARTEMFKVFDLGVEAGRVETINTVKNFAKFDSKTGVYSISRFDLEGISKEDSSNDNCN